MTNTLSYHYVEENFQRRMEKIPKFKNYSIDRLGKKYYNLNNEDFYNVYF